MGTLVRCPTPLYDPRYEQDACGVGFVVRLDGQKTHEVVRTALEAVVRLSHRGALDADARTGDGAGILVRLPRRFFAREAARLGLHVPSLYQLAVAMVFLPSDPAAAAEARRIFTRALAERQLRVLGWRPVPICPDVLGDRARRDCPTIEQALVVPTTDLTGVDYERRLYLARKTAEARWQAAAIEGAYVVSCSHRTLVYKGLLVAKQLAAFYPDLSDPDFTSDFAIFHQRYSTNTLPSWPLAQPFRFLAHNGEINTLTGNVLWMRAREADLTASVWGPDGDALRPVVMPGGSDSAMLDNVLELLVLSGRNVLHAIRLLIPEAWEHRTDLPPEWRAFYDFHAGIMEPWDGPAAIAFTDGRYVGAVLDRNGLRPLRYQVLRDGWLIAASEVGVIDVAPERVLHRGRLGPGDILAVDTATGTLLQKADVMNRLTAGRPYTNWVRRRFRFRPGQPPQTPGPTPEPLARWQRAFGWTHEDVRMVVQAMVEQGQDMVWSMGDDTPLAVLSSRRRPLSFYFKQRFAQVTNPPIDPLRETLVMSLDVYLGPRPNFLEESLDHVRAVHLTSPILSEADLAALLRSAPLRYRTLPCHFPADDPARLAPALEALLQAAEKAVDDGAEILVLTDRCIGPDRAPIPMLLAVSAVHHHLIRRGKRLQTDIVVETGTVWDIHHAALLIGFGASAVCPYLLFATARHLAVHERNLGGLSPEEAVERCRRALEKGLLKIMAKMGISTLRSYRGAQVFEVLGLAHEVVERYFPHTPARLGGVGLEDIAEDVLAWHRAAFQASTGVDRLPDIGYIRYRGDGEFHGFHPEMVRALHRAVETGDWADYERYLEVLRQAPPYTLRDLLEVVSDRPPIPLEEVEPAEDIIRRHFVVSGMSLGALSWAAHRTLAVAMNRLGARSNCGEGGEDPAWYRPQPGGDRADHRVKQVASGRFGVTTEYLVRADELEIKIAQGSKPGEGGQLPGLKVSAFIAHIRYTVPGVALISPPPHHDIYSIEDLAQLIYDLKAVNPRARVGVKLVAESGVGTIAAGVAKAYADYVHIGGMEGGTGASPLSSIKNAGCPWELGLAETQQALIRNGLRGRVRVRVDGGLKTGRDVIVAALLGAEEFGFGTAALLAMGCKMARQCHLNTCPTGIATQREDLIRARFRGTPEAVIRFFTFVAEEVRRWLAALGYRRLEEVVGRVDLLRPRTRVDHPRAAKLDLTPLLVDVAAEDSAPRRCVQARNDPPHPVFDDRVLAVIRPALERGEPVVYEGVVRNSDLTVGARIAGEIVRLHGLRGLPPRTIELRLRGAAGQSFGAFCVEGLRLVLEGEANDYVGKGMSGGEIVIRPPANAAFRPEENVIVGNTVLYGATGGRVFIAGRAGERFAVRNSGAVAVVEGVGDHACEYMTRGCVVVLGPTGWNFGAGMSHGRAYVYDPTGMFPERCHAEWVVARRLELDRAEELRSLLQDHWAATGSPRAAALLAAWPACVGDFWVVEPKAAPAVSPPAETTEQAEPVPVRVRRSG